ncbi:hypothetical protein ART_3910 [Arthrobacter sp. PAMC 25486]|uniref:endonuclease domain-containing protein n=1 Tax=Arthrobacter sp. PAMC 25486 TaxID=1494608 RepID=UPI00053614AD|nr:DUF559 domain-containing protein [Arthrobacter sp. PAMC 25486]AIY03509.1 hypothetical protein ART_3910 [Arthrobacter sp. PAMC 25486]
MTNAQPLPEGIRGRSFTLNESDSCHVTRKRTRSSGYHSPSRGIRVPWDIEQDHISQVRPILNLTQDGIASHSTAAHIWGIPLPPWLAGRFDVHISRDASKNPPSRIGTVGHHARFKPGEIVQVLGLFVTSPLRTWLDLASILDLDDLVAAGDFLVCEHDRIFGPKRVALVKIEKLREAVKHESGRRGIVKAREAADLIRVGSDSPPETRIRLSLERAGLPEMTLNFVVEDENENDCSWPDLAVPEWKIAIEYDGEHHLDPHQQDIDEARDQLMKELGWLQLRITKDMLDRDGDKAVVALVKEALRLQGWTGRLEPR